MIRIILFSVTILFLSCSDKSQKNESLNHKKKDSIFIYYNNGIVKEKGIVKNNNKIGWWTYYDELGNIIKEEEFVIYNDTVYKNQSIVYKDNGSINLSKSSYFKIDLADTLNTGWNAGKLEYHSNLSAYEKRLDVVVENNIYPDIGKKKDTFNHEKNESYFGIHLIDTGAYELKIKILETLFLLESINKDSSILVGKRHYKFYKKRVYVKNDSLI